MNIFALIMGLFAAGIVAAASERVHAHAPRWISLIAFVVALIYTSSAWLGAGSGTEEYVRQVLPWIPQFGIQVFLVLDGLSLMLVALTAFLG
ncbi:MAG: NADH-quinone oxidoreductase subunit M, partial [Pseudomonadota bacterium]|nr:NADH-quinone oxidoreductase subunit M [Pseudomonadota bacterium]